MLRAGPGGEKTLCNTCGMSYAIHGVLPVNRKDLFAVPKNDEQESATHGVSEEAHSEESQVIANGNGEATDISMVSTPASEVVVA